MNEPHTHPDFPNSEIPKTGLLGRDEIDHQLYLEAEPISLRNVARCVVRFKATFEPEAKIGPKSYRRRVDDPLFVWPVW